MNSYDRYRPHPPLSAFVKSLWLYQEEPGPYRRERRLPDGSMSLVMNLDDDSIKVYDRQQHNVSQSYRGGVLSGAHTEFTVLDSDSLISAMGVDFKPGGTYPFLPFAAADVHNMVISLETLWGEAVYELRAHLLAAKGPDHCFLILERFLLNHIVASRMSHPAIAFALQQFQHDNGQSSIADVVEQIGISQKHFIQIFRDIVGLTPKQYCRVLRFQKVLATIESGESGSMADLALTCGYFDQAHFTHDFRAFSGLTPGAYLSLRGAYRNHVTHLASC